MPRDASRCPRCLQRSTAWVFEHERWWTQTPTGVWRAWDETTHTWQPYTDSGDPLDLFDSVPAEAQTSTEVAGQVYACPRCDGVVAAEDVACRHCGQALETVAAVEGERVVRVERALPPAVEYAGWGRRFAAWLVDWAILMGVLIVLLSAIAVGAGASYETAESVGYLGFSLAMPIWFLYFAFLNGRGQTLGKRLFRIMVVDEETGEPIGFSRGAGREGIRLACWYLLSIPFFIDGLRPLWNEHHQSWHDSVARSIVVPRARPTQPAPTATADREADVPDTGAWLASEITRIRRLLDRGDTDASIRDLSEAERVASAQGYPEILPEIRGLAEEIASASHGATQRRAHRLITRIDQRHTVAGAR